MPNLMLKEKIYFLCIALIILEFLYPNLSKVLAWTSKTSPTVFISTQAFKIIF